MNNNYLLLIPHIASIFTVLVPAIVLIIIRTSKEGKFKEIKESLLAYTENVNNLSSSNPSHNPSNYHIVERGAAFDAYCHLVSFTGQLLSLIISCIASILFFAGHKALTWIYSIAVFIVFSLFLYTLIQGPDKLCPMKKYLNPWRPRKRKIGPFLQHIPPMNAQITWLRLFLLFMALVLSLVSIGFLN